MSKRNICQRWFFLAFRERMCVLWLRSLSCEWAWITTDGSRTGLHRCCRNHFWNQQFDWSYRHRHQDRNQKILGAVCQLPGGAQMSTPWWLCHCHCHCGPTIIIITTTTITMGTTSIVITLWDLYLCPNHPINYHIQKWLKQICAVSLKAGS